jgi:homogentisate 1,2-dioxygenase
MKDLEVMWIPEGTLFKVNEYDGSESIELKENEDWLMA